MLDPSRPRIEIGSRAKAEREIDPDALFAVRSRELADHYEDLAEQMGQMGEWQVEEVLRRLASATRYEPVVTNDAGEPRPEGLVSPEQLSGTGNGEHRTDPAELLSPYAVWAFAVRNEMALFDEFADLAGRADQPRIQQQSADLAGLALDRAAQWRAERRAAFHTERLSTTNARFPTINRITEYDDLIHVAVATESWMQSCLRALTKSHPGLDQARQMTEAEIARLTVAAENCVASRRLDRQLKRLAAAASSDAAEMATDGRVLAEAERLFDYYDAIFDTATGEDLLAEAQRLSRVALARIKSISGGSDRAG
jgi:hypothetical protein